MADPDTPRENPSGELTLRTLAMPADTNPHGDIFGGWLMGQMDIAGGIAASQRAQGRIATVAVDGFIFHKPVHVGDVVCCYTEVVWVGTTSISIRVQAWALRERIADARVKVTEGTFTFVALDAEGNKRTVPPLPGATATMVT
ncbi:MAG: acyl-CoA thioesterase [Rhodospirillaceae bacterium]